MILDKILIDTNICMDSALKRTPFVIPAAKILNLSETKAIKGFVASHSFDTIFYLLNNLYTIAQSYQSIESIRQTVEVAPVTESIIDDAINAKWSDFEDAIHHAAAKEAGCQAIITRNKKDFKQADLPVFSPSEFLDQLKGDKEE